MSKKKNTCERCFSKEVCSIAALSLESESKRHPDAAKFEIFKEISEKATLQIRRYFKKFVECINLEQSAENNRQESSYTTGSNKEQDMKIVAINKTEEGLIVVSLQKAISEFKSNELGERTFVNMYTRNNISFAKGFINTKHYFYKLVNKDKEGEKQLKPDEF